MAFGNLSAQIKFGSTIYALQLEEVVLNIRRSPYNQPMYGESPQQKDMGYSDPSIRIRGVLPTVTGTDDYDENIDLILEAGAGSGSTSTYRCVIADFSATLIATKEEIYWAFTMTLLAKFRDG